MLVTCRKCFRINHVSFRHNPKGYQNGNFLFFETWRFGPRLFWYTFGCLFCKTQRGIKRMGYQNGKFLSFDNFHREAQGGFVKGWFGECTGYLLVTVCGVTVCTVLCESNAASALNYSVGEPSNRFLETQSCTGC